jgi:hypothetical protein
MGLHQGIRVGKKLKNIFWNFDLFLRLTPLSFELFRDDQCCMTKSLFLHVAEIKVPLGS